MRRCALLLFLLACSAETTPHRETTPPPEPVSFPPRPDVASCRFAEGQPPSVVQEVRLSDSGIVLPDGSAIDIVAAASQGDGLLALTRDGAVWSLSDQEPVMLGAVATTRALDVAAGGGDIFVAHVGAGDVATVTRLADGLNVVATGASDSAALAFDDGGLLYVAFGSAGLDDMADDADDPLTLPGTISRLDVSTLDTTGYTVPADNPVPGNYYLPGDTPLRAWAIGVRRPTGMAFSDGRLWLADQGEGVGEIHRVKKAQHLGWPRFDGTTCREAQCDLELDKFPQSLIDGDDACPIGLGGFGLDGMLFISASCRGDIYAIKTNAPDGWLRRERIAQLAPPLIDIANMVAVGNAAMRIEPLHPDGFFPMSLADSGCFDADMSPRPGVYRYDVAAELWSDGSHKTRYLELPPGETIAVQADGSWSFPAGTVVIKRFEHNGRDVETRVMVLRNFGWEVHSYKWNDDQGDATLLDDHDSAVITTADATFEHTFPNRRSCIVCHGTDSARLLAVKSRQLNRGGQLAAFEAIDMFSGEALSDVTMPGLESSAPAADRARAYLDANCGHCHRPGGWVPAVLDIDLRYETPLSQMALCGVATTSGEAGERLIPGNADGSRIYQRVATRDFWQMPPLATEIAHDDGVQVIGAWIDGLASCPE